MTTTDALAIVGSGLVFLGVFLIWWQLAIILLGATLLTTAVGLALLGREGVAGSGRDEG